MVDREKVINDFIKSIGIISRVDEPTFWLDFVRISMENALKLLKAQKPVKPILKRKALNAMYNDYVCPICNQEIVYEQKYCCECGRAVKWDDT